MLRVTGAGLDGLHALGGTVFPHRGALQWASLHERRQETVFV